MTAELCDDWPIGSEVRAKPSDGLFGCIGSEDRPSGIAWSDVEETEGQRNNTKKK